MPESMITHLFSSTVALAGFVAARQAADLEQLPELRFETLVIDTDGMCASMVITQSKTIRELLKAFRTSRYRADAEISGTKE